MFATLVARQQEAIFRALGEDASWPGVEGDVRVILRDKDDDSSFGQGRIVIRRYFLRVRASDVGQPKKGDVLTIAEVSYRLTDTPRLDRKEVWGADVEKLA